MLVLQDLNMDVSDVGSVIYSVFFVTRLSLLTPFVHFRIDCSQVTKKEIVDSTRASLRPRPPSRSGVVATNQE